MTRCSSAACFVARFFLHSNAEAPEPKALFVEERSKTAFERQIQIKDLHGVTHTLVLLGAGCRRKTFLFYPVNVYAVAAYAADAPSLEKLKHEVRCFILVFHMCFYVGCTFVCSEPQDQCLIFTLLFGFTNTQFPLYC